MIIKLSSEDANEIYKIINQAAHAYKGVIPDDRYHDPYMTRQELQNEMGNMTFFGLQEESKLIGVMGFQPVKDVTLIRHAYVLPDYQRNGVGLILLNYIKQKVKTRHLLVGTWEDASWAIKFYQKYGFNLMPNKDELLRKYWGIPRHQIEISVVLGIEISQN